jgi:hypothetical protein
MGRFYIKFKLKGEKDAQKFYSHFGDIRDQPRSIWIRLRLPHAHCFTYISVSRWYHSIAQPHPISSPISTL